MPPITVRDVMRLALPSGTSVAAGAAGLSHQVTWVVTPRATPPVFSNLRGGELALVPMAAVQQLDERMTLADLVERLAPVPIAGVVVVGEIGEPDRAAAERAEVIVAGADRVDVRRAVAALRDLGHRHILCEGGPRLNAQLVAAGLVDELCLTISPMLVGGGAARILDGTSSPTGLRLAHVLTDNGFLFCRYTREDVT